MQWHSGLGGEHARTSAFHCLETSNSSQNSFGYNMGAGITRKMPSGVEIYAEYRFTHGSTNGITTDVRPITVGVRW